MKRLYIVRSSLLPLLAALLVASAPAARSQSRVLLNGDSLFISGANIAWVNYAQDLGPRKLDTASFITAFDSIHAHGGNAMRLWLHVNGVNTPAFGSDSMVTGPGEIAVASLNKILDLAWQRHIGLMLCLWSFNMEDTSIGTLYADRNRLLLKDTVYTRAYINNALIPMVQAVQGHKGILAWEVFNEPEGMTDSLGWSTTYKNVGMLDVQRFVNLVAGAIHRADPTAKVTTGAASLGTETDVNGIAKPMDVETRLNAMSAGEKQKMEAAFAAHYGFSLPVAEILSAQATANYNYYRDDRLIAAGGDTSGTLDFYTAHYYSEWQGTALSPLHHSASTWQLTKPLVIGEFFPWATLSIPHTDLFPLLYGNGYAGGMTWGWYSGATGYDQDTLQANTLVELQKMWNLYPDEIDPVPVAGNVYSFYVTPAAIDSGESAVVYWKTARGTTVTLNDSVVAIRDSLAVSPGSTTTYTLRTSGTVSDTSSQTLEVYRSGKIMSFTSSEYKAGTNDEITLRWRTSHASTVYLDGTPVGSLDSTTFRITSTGTYTLIAEGARRDTASVTVTVVSSDEYNRAVGGTISVSGTGTTTGYTDPNNIIDDNTSTGWESTAAENQYVILDLGQNIYLQTILVFWGSNYPSVFWIQSSTSGSSWTPLLKVTGGTGSAVELDSINQNARYVRLWLRTRSSTTGGFIVRDLQVFGVAQAATGIASSTTEIPSAYALNQNYPNPFNPSTTIRFGLPAQSRVTMSVYNILGQHVATLISGELEAGYHSVVWNAKAATGIYFCRMDAVSEAKSPARFSQTIKLLLVR